VGLSRKATLAAALVGALAGVGGFTFRHAEGLSYMSSDPSVCHNCHIMNDQFDSWRKGSHHAAAGCVDCHLPTDLIGKYLAKASNGYHHSKGFTLQDFHEPIMIKPGNSQILQDNCVRCHAGLVHEIVKGSTTGPDAVRCVHCHRSVGHGS
jgi:cytochrome c nitrite reductase small subunit